MMIVPTLLSIAGVSILSKAYWNTFRPELKNVIIPASVSQQRLANDCKIFHLTDIHIEKLSVKPEKVLQMAGQETYDIIALTGDYVDKIKSIPKFIHFLKQIVKIPNKYGIFAVWGNHDWLLKDKLSLLKEEMEKLGVIVLANQSVTVEQQDGSPLHIIGIDDRYSGHSNPELAFQNVTDDGARLILTHDPLIVRDLKYRFDYLICGHFHAGQVFYPLPVHSLKMGLKPFKKHLSGLQQHANGIYYISAGLGQTGPNLRLGCRPEVTIHTIQGRADSRPQTDEKSKKQNCLVYVSPASA